MKRIFTFALLCLMGTTGICKTWVITNSADTFVPDTLTIALGDSVRFTVASIHQPLEVSKATWDANGATPLPGGFDLPFGGGLVLPAQLQAGIHYYVCSVHVAFGMKGTITVQNTSGLANNNLKTEFSISPNPVVNSMRLNSSPDLQGIQYYMMDTSGKQVLEGRLNESLTNVDVSMLLPGVYLLQVSGQRKFSVKVIKN